MLCVESFPDGNQPPPKEEEDSGGRERNLIDAIFFLGLFLSREGIPAPEKLLSSSSFLPYSFSSSHPSPSPCCVCALNSVAADWARHRRISSASSDTVRPRFFFHPFCRRCRRSSSTLYPLIYFLRRTHTFIPCASLVSSLCVCGGLSPTASNQA